MYSIERQVLIKIKTIPVILEQNCCVIFDSERAIVSDPGSNAEEIKEFCDSNSLRIEEIWLTHSHFDHAGGVSALLELCPERPKLIAHNSEKEFRQNIDMQALMFGIPGGMIRNCPEPDEEFSEGALSVLDNLDVQVLFTPGHAPGHFSFYLGEDSIEVDGVLHSGGVLIAGDTLFRGSIGRTDLPGGDYAQLISSIKEKLLVLPESTLVLPGHGDSTTIGEERRTNPFLKL